VVYPNQPNLLILGPFQGHVACQSIRFGKGVCGAAAAEKEAKIIDNVDCFPGHIACDSKSRSEIVVPIVVNDQVIALISLYRH
jgi:L-methionine (R)-S-oxide reductase